MSSNNNVKQSEMDNDDYVDDDDYDMDESIPIILGGVVGDDEQQQLLPHHHDLINNFPYECKTEKEIEYVNVEHIFEEVYLEDHSTPDEAESENDYYTVLNIAETLENGEEKEGEQSNDLYNCSKCLIQLTFTDIQDHIKNYHKNEKVLLDMEEESMTETNEWSDVLNSESNNDTERFNIEKLTQIECNICQKKFKNKRSLTNHLPMHNRKKDTLLVVNHNNNNNNNNNNNTNIIINSKQSNNNNADDILEQQSMKKPIRRPYIKKNSGVAINKIPIKKSKKKNSKTINQLTGEEEKIKSNCNICNTQFQSQKGLLLHMKMHQPHKQRSFQDFLDKRDGVNDRKNNDGDDLTIRNNHHDDDDDNDNGDDDNGDEKKMGKKLQFYCELCSKSYDKTFETIHLRMHSTETMDYVCSQCNINFDDEKSLSMHLNIVHQEGRIMGQSKHPSALRIGDDSVKREYACTYCGKEFLRPHEKVKHERIHTGEKPHKCEICGKRFRVTYCLTLHMRTHTTDRPYVCIHCNKRFKSNSVYSHHLLTHSDVRAFACPFCPKQFKTQVQLAGHKNSHTKPFPCPECNRPFATLYAVRAHMTVHSKSNHNLRYACEICGATYARSFALKDHIKEHHPNAKISTTGTATATAAAATGQETTASSSTTITNLVDELHLQSEIFNDDSKNNNIDNQSSLQQQQQQQQQQPLRKLRSSSSSIVKPKKSSKRNNKKSNTTNIQTSSSSQSIAFDSTFNLLTGDHHHNLVDSTINDYGSGSDLQPEVVNDEPIIVSIITDELPIEQSSNMKSNEFSTINDNVQTTIPDFEEITSFI